jgi:hypothetical protein
MMATCGETNQIFRPVTMFDYGIDGEVEFKGTMGRPEGARSTCSSRAAGLTCGRGRATRIPSST